MLEYIDIERLNARVGQDAERFRTAAPFRHIVFDDLLPKKAKQAVTDAFPDQQWTGWKDNNNEHQRLKMSCTDVAAIPGPLRQLIFELNSGAVMSWLGRLTGIENVLPDPHLIGGGLHMTLPGGMLTPHTDFHRVRGNPLFRRLNLLVYLNPGWSADNGGCLELWDKKTDKIVHQVMPELGRCVIFQTDDDSVHGFSKPLVDRPRCSVAMYYYTATDASRFSGDGATYWRVRSVKPENSGDWARLHAQRLFLGLSRVSSGVSWRTAKIAQRFQH